MHLFLLYMGSNLHISSVDYSEKVVEGGDIVLICDYLQNVEVLPVWAALFPSERL